MNVDRIVEGVTDRKAAQPQGALQLIVDVTGRRDGHNFVIVWHLTYIRTCHIFKTPTTATRQPRKDAPMTIAQIAEKVHEETGATGAELEMRVHFIAMLTADAMGNKAIGDYFQRRMRDAFAKTKK